jgi:hypothetical protein
MSWQYLLAWLLPLFAGSGLVLAIGGGRRMPGNLCAMLGTGFLLGVFVAGILCSLIARENVQGAFADVAPWLAAIGILAWVAALGLRGKPWPEASFNKSGLGWRLVWCLLLAMIGLSHPFIGERSALAPYVPVGRMGSLGGEAQGMVSARSLRRIRAYAAMAREPRHDPANIGNLGLPGTARMGPGVVCQCRGRLE